ncbi:16S rRNA methyltransferase [Sulfuricella sp. T08]|uniref:16S rRNA (uracil(1498)-N(3))-methyltransferase n=1 Tax=Sulfuricella sp. T08 TaxID=1632857 RepID=UPI0006179EBE|nr:16S rRNA (uracil(1498)-N(3))-methyltransferase [Sulfuricella sp. T08]GAO34737.1 16S rRNA methyltransferase [Sulfuricella sp. T08]
MTTPRFYCPEILAQSGMAELPEQAAHHAARVLRLQTGDKLSVFNGRGGEGEARITDIGKRNVTVEIVGWHAVERESPLQVLLAQAISAGEKMDFTLQKAVELGIGNIQPLASERSVVKLSGERAEKRVAHWQGVVVAACEQSGRNRVPEVAPIRPLLDWLGQQEGPGLHLMLSPVAEVGLRDLSKPTGNITLLVGPEGGLSPAEAEAAQRYGYTPVRLGARVLRTETAALAVLAAMQTLWGDF